MLTSRRRLVGDSRSHNRNSTFQRAILAGALAFTGAALLSACADKKNPAVETSSTQPWIESDQPVFDLNAATTRPASVPEPRLIEEGDNSTLIYTCRHARPEVLRDAVDGLVSPEGSTQAAPSLNAVIVSDRKETVASILKVLQELDRPSNQLLVEARVVEVTLDSDLEYEIRHALTIPAGNNSSFLQTSDVTLRTPGASPTINQGISINIRPYFSDGKRLDEFIRYLVTRGKAKLLSSPNLVVSPGTEASIITGEEVPIQSTQIVAGSLSTNTQFKRVGIKLRVLLQQVTNDTARLEINPEVSAVTGFTDPGDSGVSNPIVAIRNVSSIVSMKDGEILTVGGLLRDEDRQIIRGVPGLMDVPGLGLLFQSRRHQTVKTQLIFFMRIRVMGDGMINTTRVAKPGAGLDAIELKTKTVLPEAPKTPTEKKEEKQRDPASDKKDEKKEGTP